MKKHLLLALPIMLLATSSFAQMPYTLSVYHQAYVPLDSARQIDSGMVWTNYTYFAAPIGFTFHLDTANCPNYLNEGGSSVVTDTAYTTFSGFAITDAALDDRGFPGDTMSLSPVRYKITGTTGSRIFKSEFFNAGFDQEYQATGVMNDSLNYQVWYYEDSEIVELRYGPSRITRTDYFTFGGNITAYLQHLDTNGNGTAYILGGNPNSPAVQTVPLVGGNPTTTFHPLSSFPTSGTVYRFAPIHHSLKTGLFTEENIAVYPTNCTNEVTIKFAGTETPTYDVVSINGVHMNISGFAKNGLTKINISNLPSGMYLLHLQGNEDSKVYKFIKM